MTHHQHVSDAQHIDSKQKGGIKIDVTHRREVGDVAVNEHLARIEIDNFCCWNAAIGTAHPKITRALLADEPRKEIGIALRLSPRPFEVPIEQVGYAVTIGQTH